MAMKVQAFNMELRHIFNFVWSIEYLTSCGVASLLRIRLLDDFVRQECWWHQTVAFTLILFDDVALN